VSLRKLGRYDLVRVLGKGAMGIVYEGRDPNLDRHVAIKTVKVENLSEEAAAEYEARFRTEARSAARLQHPNIVSVYDSDRDGDIAFLVMEYIQGDDLKHHLDKGVRYSLEQALKMVRDLLSALDYAHRQGIVHRDIKPANLLIEPGGRVKLTDFGVARMQDSGDATRTQGTMVGTLKYMAPEQVQGQKIDARADLFSVGVVLYQLLTDKRPFDGENDFSIIHQIIGHTPPPPSSFNARLPPAIDAVVARALAKNREGRFASARDFASALQSAMRRVEDTTVVPPADPSRQSAFGGSTHGGSRSLSAPGGVSVPTSGSTVTQEVELVYWKDVKDSGDPEELQDFLVKFPAGIYADLARRRLRKLSSTMVFEATVAKPEATDDPEATRLREPTSPSNISPVTAAGAAPPVATAPVGAAAPTPSPVVVSQAPAVTASAATKAVEDAPAVPAPAVAPFLPSVARDEVPLPSAVVRGPTADKTAPLAIGAAAPAEPDVSRGFATTVAEPHEPEPPARHVITDKVGGRAAPRQPVRAPAAPIEPVNRRRFPMPALAGIGVLAVAGIAAVLLITGKGDKEKPSASAAEDAPAAVAKAPPPQMPSNPDESTAPVVAVPAVASRSAVAASAVSARPPASAGRKPLATAKGKAAVPAPPVEAERTVAVVPQSIEVRDEQRPPPPPVVARASPVDECKDKMFLSREFCLAEQCAKPGTQNHPLCVKRREDAKLREESKVRN
jgi:serine/threonine-protein kinase